MRILRALAILLALCVPAWAQDLTMGVGQGQSVFTYSGPGDAVAGAVVFYGLRAFNSSYAAAQGNVAVFQRNSDNATCTAIVTKRGDLDVWGSYCSGSTTLTQFCSGVGVGCWVATMYDQAGGAHNLTGTPFNTPQLFFAGCLGGAPPNWNIPRPCLVQNRAGAVLGSASSAISTAQPLTMVMVAQRNGFASSDNTAFGCGGNTAGNSVFVQTGFSSTPGTGYMFAGSFVRGIGTVSDFNIHSLQMIFNAASSSYTVDGVTTGSLNPSTADCSSNNGVIWMEPGANRFDGYVAEAGIWSGALSGPQLTAMRANQKAYWGTP